MGAQRALGLLIGAAADAAFADPRRGHPVAFFGRAADRLERLCHADSRLAGAAYTAALVGGAAGLGRLLERLGRRSPLGGVAATALATWAVLGGASLAREAAAVAGALHGGDLSAARGHLPSLCGRDPDQLDAAGLARASVESVAENTSDAVVAPLVWGAVAGVPGLLAYRAVNTLDAMVGYRTERHRRFGWAAARLDDLANLLPARLTAALAVLCAPVLGGSARGAWRTWHCDAAAHPSPNAGQVEAAFAGALGVRLGGRTAYRHGVEQRPVLGDGGPPDAGDLTRAVELSRLIGVVAAGLAALIALLCARPCPRPSRAGDVRTLRRV